MNEENERFPKSEELLECVLTEKELLDKGGQLSKKNQERDRLEDEKKTITSEFKAKVDSCNAEIAKLALVVSSGRESRKIRCETRYNTPEHGMKSLVRLDTEETVKIESMSISELSNLWINRLGEIDDVFIFSDRKEVPLFDRETLTPEDIGKWEKLTSPLPAAELYTHPLENKKEYRVIKGIEDENILYMLQTKTKTAKK